MLLIETGKEVSQVSVAASGLVWAVTWHGSVLVRRYSRNIFCSDRYIVNSKGKENTYVLCSTGPVHLSFSIDSR